MRPGKNFTRLAVASVLTAAVLYPGYRTLRNFSEQLEILELEIEAVETENRRLEEEIKALREDGFYIEKRAREMGLIKEGETIYSIRFVEEEKDEGGPP